MKESRFTDSQIMDALKRAEAGLAGNAYVERFNRTVLYEWLAQQLFDTIEEVQEFATQWIWNYNHERPHMALGGITPFHRRAMVAKSLLKTTVKYGRITRDVNARI